MRRGVRSAAAAVTFLTAVPIGRRTPLEGRDLAGGAVLFPVVGALVGGLVASVAWGASFLLPPLVAAVLGVASGVLVTGALHLDGLADVADAIGAALTGRDPSSVMRDPRLGTFGVAAVVLDLTLKIAVLSALIAGERFPVEAVAASALARVAPLGLAAALPYVGPAGGSGAWTSRVGLGVGLLGLAIASAVGLPAVGLAFGAMVAAGALATALVGRWSAVRLGGVTGDVLGSSAELTETLALTAALALR